MALPRRRSAPLLVAIVGGSGSGKTWLARKLAAALAPHTVRLSLDDFYRDRSHLSPQRRARINFDQPGAIDWAATETAIYALARGRSARVPTYDFKTHRRARTKRILHPRPIVLIEGLWLLRRRSLRRLFPVRIFVRCPARLRFRRRLERDRRSRGRTEASVRAQFRNLVEPMHRLYVAPQRRWANVILPAHSGPKQFRALVARLHAGICPN